MTRLYSKEKNYNLEHFIISPKTTGTIDWVVSWGQNRKGKRVPNVEKIKPVYEIFLREYFDGIETKEKIQRAFFEVF